MSLTEIRLFHEHAGTALDGKVIVLRDAKADRYYREWLRHGGQFKFVWVAALSCARYFPIHDRILAESFQRFILDRSSVETVLYVVEKNRLLTLLNPAPRKVVKSRPLVKVVDLKKSLRDFRV